MNIIKEYCPRAGKAVIRTDTYTHTMEHFDELFLIAIEDFGHVGTNEVEINHFGGRTYKNTWGITFPVDSQDVTDEYRRINYLEITL